MNRKRLIILALMTALVLPACKNDTLDLQVRFDQVQGLKQGDRVLFEQSHIGDVKRVFYTEQGAFLVDIAIDHNFAAAATEHSRFVVVSDPVNTPAKALAMTHLRQGGTPLADKTVVQGTTEAALLVQKIFDGIESGIKSFEEQLHQFSKELGDIPESEEFKRLENEFNRLAEELKQSGRETRDKIKTEILPQLRQDMEDLRRRLRELGREEEIKPLEVKMEEIQRI